MDDERRFAPGGSGDPSAGVYILASGSGPKPPAGVYMLASGSGPKPPAGVCILASGSGPKGRQWLGPAVRPGKGSEYKTSAEGATLSQKHILDHI
jgi:hypothetical protein